ncbi:MAG: hypothetical protein QXK74_05940 [Candidatus Nitrosocaldaceae archaeon]
MNLIEIVEGKTKLLIPKDSLNSNTPPKDPAFFNPKARMSRDMAVLAYRAYQDKAEIIDALAGIGARGLRAVKEAENIRYAYINDINPQAIEIAKEISKINDILNCKFSICPANRLLVESERVSIVEIDPFGTPVYYIDNAIRAVKDGGMICITATDTPVLQGLYPRIALRRYYGLSLRSEYSNEIGLRLMLGLLAFTAARLELAIKPLFVHAIRNHLRVYAKIIVSRKGADSMLDNLKCVYHCFKCNNRGLDKTCTNCMKDMNRVGPLWIGEIFDKEFVNKMKNAYDETLDKRCMKVLSIAEDELDVISYYTIDEISKRLRITPIKLEQIVYRLKSNGFKASRTSLMLNGFKSDADYNTILKILA